MKKILTRYFSGEDFDYHFVLSLLGPVIFDQFFWWFLILSTRQ